MEQCYATTNMYFEFERVRKASPHTSSLPVDFLRRPLVSLDPSVSTFVFGGDDGRAADDRTSVNFVPEEKVWQMVRSIIPTHSGDPPLRQISSFFTNHNHLRLFKRLLPAKKVDRRT